MYGHLETISCRDCGWIQHSTVYPGDELAVIGDATSYARVRIDWLADIPLHKQIAAARRMFARLAERPASELLNDARRSNSLELGTYSLSLAIELQIQGKANGVRLSFGEIIE